MATTKRVTLKQYLYEELPQLKKLTLEKQKTIIMDEIQQELVLLVKKSPVDTGFFAQSWGVTQTEDKILLGNSAPYAPQIEMGARPFTPPLGPLLAWAKRVLQDPSQPPKYSPEVQALARGTQNKIAKFGLKPHRLLEQAVDDIMERVAARVRQL
jgi:hypothetical protein